MSEQHVITGIINPANGAERAGVRVQAFNLNPPSKQSMSLKSLNSNPQKTTRKLDMPQSFFITENTDFVGDEMLIGLVEERYRPFYLTSDMNLQTTSH